MSWQLVYSRQAQKDAKKLAAAHLKKQTQALLDILANDLFARPPRFENWSAIWRVRIHGGTHYQ
ncbi:hypothetical protein GJ698_23215 [Pseudoduganella sp. FT26W]|uniref:Type II toxin-antitoxin system mRNA interferase toxin, RelE/StbE family n=1 Tax=Duganella aquatilis TaxID=2666082 RepID=A0A844DFS3_9BURK|nr:hypothetical protein [Duganella aquatilis]MRW86984.1 hypothetical protein [Duganella aquatilis]